MKNIYTDRLDSFSFTEMLEALRGVGTETQRLEFKREIPPKKLGHRVCSLANASGGVIVIGIDNPVVGDVLRFAPVPTNVSDKKQLSYTSSVNAWVYPQPPFEMFPYADEESGNTFLVVRVAASSVGPHEYIGGDESNLPIRRGTETKTLSLADIEALQRR
jgi:predicted HTH transcriptional regulator